MSEGVRAGSRAYDKLRHVSGPENISFVIGED
jgi:hypothetical protein